MRPNPDAESRRSFTGSARREQITRAAIDVLAENGYAATSFSVIADRLAVSKGVLSYHFSDKADLLQAVVQLVLGEAESWMTPRIEGAASYREALHRYITANVSFLASHTADILALTEVIANARVTPGVPELFEESQTAAISALETLFVDGQRAGEFGAVPANILAMSLRATIDSASARLRTEPEFDLGKFEADVVSLFAQAVALEPINKLADRASRTN
jgi:AcrR family transcriptional regulator